MFTFEKLYLLMGEPVFTYGGPVFTYEAPCVYFSGASLCLSIGVPCVCFVLVGGSAWCVCPWESLCLFFVGVFLGLPIGVPYVYF